MQGMECKEGYDCYCKPCVKAFEVSVYEYSHGEDDDHLSQEFYGSDREGCSKMSVCGVVQQTKEITFRAYDNKEREGATFRVLMHDEDESRELKVQRINNTWAYEFSWSDDKEGVGIMEIFVNGEQIPE